MDGFMREISLKLMIWAYPHFSKLPYANTPQITSAIVIHSEPTELSQLGKQNEAPPCRILLISRGQTLRTSLWSRAAKRTLSPVQTSPIPVASSSRPVLRGPFPAKNRQFCLGMYWEIYDYHELMIFGSEICAGGQAGRFEVAELMAFGSILYGERIYQHYFIV